MRGAGRGIRLGLTPASPHTSKNPSPTHYLFILIVITLPTASVNCHTRVERILMSAAVVSWSFSVDVTVCVGCISLQKLSIQPYLVRVLSVWDTMYSEMQICVYLSWIWLFTYLWGPKACLDMGPQKVSTETVAAYWYNKQHNGTSIICNCGMK